MNSAFSGLLFGLDRKTAAQVRTLRRQGVKVEVIGEVVSDLNGRLFSRLFDMVAPDEIRAGGCLIVMGSEGRGEQTVRTDQGAQPQAPAAWVAVVRLSCT